jgi:hypothetical protein
MIEYVYVNGLRLQVDVMWPTFHLRVGLYCTPSQATTIVLLTQMIASSSSFHVLSATAQLEAMQEVGECMLERGNVESGILLLIKQALWCT